MDGEACVRSTESELLDAAFAKQGFLYKRGHLRRNWTNRFFCVLEDRGSGGLVLGYYKNKPTSIDGVLPRGTVPLTGATVSSVAVDGHPFGFSVSTQPPDSKKSSIQYYLRAASSEDRQMWASSLELLIAASETRYSKGHMQSVAARNRYIQPTSIIVEPVGNVSGEQTSKATPETRFGTSPSTGESTAQVTAEPLASSGRASSKMGIISDHIATGGHPVVARIVVDPGFVHVSSSPKSSLATPQVISSSLEIFSSSADVKQKGIVDVVSNSCGEGLPPAWMLPDIAPGLEEWHGGEDPLNFLSPPLPPPPPPQMASTRSDMSEGGDQRGDTASKDLTWRVSLPNQHDGVRSSVQWQGLETRAARAVSVNLRFTTVLERESASDDEVDCHIENVNNNGAEKGHDGVIVDATALELSTWAAIEEEAEASYPAEDAAAKAWLVHRQFDLINLLAEKKSKRFPLYKTNAM